MLAAPHVAEVARVGGRAGRPLSHAAVPAVPRDVGTQGLSPAAGASDGAAIAAAPCTDQPFLPGRNEADCACAVGGCNLCHALWKGRMPVSVQP